MIHSLYFRTGRRHLKIQIELKQSIPSKRTTTRGRKSYPSFNDPRMETMAQKIITYFRQVELKAILPSNLGNVKLPGTLQTNLEVRTCFTRNIRFI